MRCLTVIPRTHKCDLIMTQNGDNVEQALNEDESACLPTHNLTPGHLYIITIHQQRSRFRSAAKRRPFHIFPLVETLAAQAQHLHSTS